MSMGGQQGPFVALSKALAGARQVLSRSMHPRRSLLKCHQIILKRDQECDVWHPSCMTSLKQWKPINPGQSSPPSASKAGKICSAGLSKASQTCPQVGRYLEAA
mmetsp:Transcript_115730/g.204575  ORF Transcript_115730/g.204575 Transcript_115730/m.204575 type:complete len:104 (-) Transcript_115730:242-553(-)